MYKCVGDQRGNESNGHYTRCNSGFWVGSTWIRREDLYARLGEWAPSHTHPAPVSELCRFLLSVFLLSQFYPALQSSSCSMHRGHLKSSFLLVDCVFFIIFTHLSYLSSSIQTVRHCVRFYQLLFLVFRNPPYCLVLYTVKTINLAFSLLFFQISISSTCSLSACQLFYSQTSATVLSTIER